MPMITYKFIVICDAVDLLPDNFNLEDYEAVGAWFRAHPDVIVPNCFSFEPDWDCRSCQYARADIETSEWSLYAREDRLL